MTTPKHWHPLMGEWTGINRLWVTPDEPARESETTASTTLAAQGRFLALRYTWTDEGRPQDGEMLIGLDPKRKQVHAAWIDSWHMGDRFMVLAGEPREDEAIVVRGTYEAPPGPDWGWRIEIRPEAEDAFELLMYNLSPESEEVLAVEATYSRRE